VLPKAGNVTNSDFNVLIEPGDLGSNWVDRLFKTYCANAFIDLVPMNGWAQPTLLLEADLPATPAVTLYDSESTAIAHGVATPTYLQLFRKVNLKMLKPEANDIYTQGKDYRLQRPILSHHDVPTDIDPTTIPASRTPAWRGQRISYSWNDPNISTQQVCNDSNDVLFARLTIARSMGEFEFDFKSLLRRGKLVKLYFATGGGMFSATDGTKVNPATARIKSVSASFVYTANDGVGMKWRPTRYVVQNGTDASILNSEHTDLKRIAADWLMRAFSKNTQLGDANDKNLWRRPLSSQDTL
jgi:hypothetical protein